MRDTRRQLMLARALTVLALVCAAGSGLAVERSADASVTVRTAAYSGGQMMAADPNGGYWTAGATGAMTAHDDAPSWGSPALSKLTLARPIVGMASTPDGGGYWLVASDGGIFNFGDAGFHGSTGAIHLNRPIVGMAATADGRGYWLVASDGGIFSFGDAAFYGSTGAIHLNKPIVGMAATADGRGYWLVASDGGVFTFGDAGYFGSLGAIHLNQPIVGMAPTPNGGGYWLVASDGGVFTFGDAGYDGSTAGTGVSVLGIVINPSTSGYSVVATNGSETKFGPPAPTPPSATTTTTTATAPTPPTTTTSTAPPSSTTTTTTATSPTTTTTTAPPSSGGPAGLGVYAGNNNPAGVNSFASATGAHVTMAETYLPWAAYTGSAYGWAYLTTESTLSSWLSNWEGSSDQMVMGVPMVALDGSGNPENTLAQGAAGDENANFVAIAKNLVALGFGNAVLRPGWEFDGTWYPWSVASNVDAANFATYWQNVVTSMRSVPGANFKFLWSPAGFQSLSWNINDAYPGNAYVDDVSFDVYDWSWDTSIFPPSGDPANTTTVAQSNAVFSELLNDTEGLNWLSSFAQAHDEPIVIPEWAVTNRNDGHGLGDDPTFINNMSSWFITNHVAWSIYFTDDTADNVNQGIDFQVTDGNFPNSLAALKTHFG